MYVWSIIYVYVCLWDDIRKIVKGRLEERKMKREGKKSYVNIVKIYDNLKEIFFIKCSIMYNEYIYRNNKYIII